MKINELRIGNFVDIINRNTPVHLPMGCKLKIGEISFFEVKLYAIDKPFATQVIPEPTDIKDLTPIPLTEEWLLNLGFVFEDKALYNKYPAYTIKSIWYYVFNSGEFGRRTTMTSNVNEEWGKPDNERRWESTSLTQIKYLHELQNLYYALTGEEL